MGNKRQLFQTACSFLVNAFSYDGYFISFLKLKKFSTYYEHKVPVYL